jgi:hypothetical protein
VSKLTETTQATRILQAMMVLQQITRGVDKATACESNGLSVWQFDEWMSSENSAITQLQTSIVEAERIRLAQIVNAQAIILDKLIDTVTIPGYADQDIQLKVLKYLDKLRNELEVKHGVQSHTDDAQEYELQGPNTRIEKSQMAVQHELSRSVVNLKPMPDGSVDVSMQTPITIIDLNSKEASRPSLPADLPENHPDDSHE